MAITIRVNLAVIAATIIGELASVAWQSDALPWGRYEDHYLITALVADFTLAVILEWITRYAYHTDHSAFFCTRCVRQAVHRKYLNSCE